jgi:hypothetical protein
VRERKYKEVVCAFTQNDRSKILHVENSYMYKIAVKWRNSIDMLVIGSIRTKHNTHLRKVKNPTENITIFVTFYESFW